MAKLKRILFGVLVIVLVLVLGVVGLLVSAFAGNAPLPESADLPGGARLVKDSYVAAFVVPAGGASVALVDCGNDPEAKPILTELARRGNTPGDVTAIFLTHGHGDHTGGCKAFPNAKVMALGPDIGIAAGTDVSQGLLTRFFRNGPDKAVTVSRAVKDGEVVQVGGVGGLEVRVFAIPGHTDGSAAYLANGVLYLGDSATDRSDGTFDGAPWPFSNSVPQNHASLRSLWNRLQAEHLAVKALAPSHSAPREGAATFEAFAKRAD